jgi:hypothetical protein
MIRQRIFFLSLIVILILSLFQNSFAQKPAPKDSLKKLEMDSHSPRLATIYSAVLPGLGQVYNKKYWKVPIIYAGFAALTYSLIFNDQKYSLYLNEYTNRLFKDSANMKPDLLKYSDDNVLELKNYYQKDRELSIIGFVILYTLNIVDATVDGHLYSFDVSDNLSMNVEPFIIKGNNRTSSLTSGFQLTFKPTNYTDFKRNRIKKLLQ